MKRGQFLVRVAGTAILLIGLGAFVALYSDTADWAAPRGRHSAWVGGWPTYFRRLVAGTCTLGGLAILGRSFRRRGQKCMGLEPQD